MNDEPGGLNASIIRVVEQGAERTEGLPAGASRRGVF